MRLASDGGQDAGYGVEEIALVRTNSATVEIKFFGPVSPLGPLFIYSSPRMPPDAPLRPCGCNPFVGHVIARSIEDARRLRDTLDAAIKRVEAV